MLLRVVTSNFALSHYLRSDILQYLRQSTVWLIQKVRWQGRAFKTEIGVYLEKGLHASNCLRLTTSDFGADKIVISERVRGQKYTVTLCARWPLKLDENNGSEGSLRPTPSSHAASLVR